MGGKLFVSYRREDAPGDARSICDRLGRSFGAANVFMDVDRLLAGQRFDRELDKALAKCDVLIAVIGSRWIALMSEHAQRGKRDYVRDEIAAALKRDIVVIPVLIGREASMPPLPLAEDLPENIRDLVFYQKHNITHESFSRDAAHLVAAIKAVLRDKGGPRPWRAIAVAGAGMVVLTLVVALLGDWMNVLGRVWPSSSLSSVGRSESPGPTVQSSEAAPKRTEEVAVKGLSEEIKRQAEIDAARKKAEEEAARKVSQPVETTRCDQLAASPYDDDRPREVTGVFDPFRIDISAGVACQSAIDKYPAAARFIFQAGRVAYGRRDFARAAELYLQAIGKGSVAAYAGLGIIYVYGSGVPQDYVIARNIYEKGAAQNNSLALSDLGVLHDFGFGGKQDFVQARSLYERAAALGNAQAMANLGVLYEYGHGVPQDYITARKWYEKAAALGNAVAMRNLGSLYENGKRVPTDFEIAKDWYNKAAGRGDSGAMNNLGTVQ